MRTIYAVTFAAITLLCVPRLGRTQENTEASVQGKSAKPAVQESKSATERPRPIRPFRLDFSLNEMEDGKKINTRHYSLNLTAGNADELKIGTRVPMLVGGPGSQYQYVDLGTNIWALLRDIADDLQLEVRSETSWAKATSNNNVPDAQHDHSSVLPPIVSQVKINGSTLLVTGKPIIIGSADDPYSNRQFQLEVTATQLR